MAGKGRIKVWKVLLNLLWIIPTSLIMLILLLYMLSPIVNEFALKGYRSQVVEELVLPPGIQMMETVSGCGNSGGTGNHTDLYVGVLVESSLSKEQLEQQLEQYEVGCSVSPLTSEEPTNLSMDLLGLSFEAELDFSADQYYLLQFVEEAPCSAFDLRGY